MSQETDWLMTAEEKQVLVRNIHKCIDDVCPGNKFLFTTIVVSSNPANEKVDVIGNLSPNDMDALFKTLANQTPAFEVRMENH